MTTTKATPQQPTTGLAQAMKTAFIRFCGEQKIAYNVEVLGLLGKVGAGVAFKDRQRREATPAPATAAPVAAPPAKPLVVMSSGDRRILRLLAAGRPNKEIATEVGRSTDVVRGRLRQIYAALGARDRASAVAMGYELGLLGADARAAERGAVRPPAGPPVAGSGPAASGAPEAGAA